MPAFWETGRLLLVHFALGGRPRFLDPGFGSVAGFAATFFFSAPLAGAAFLAAISISFLDSFRRTNGTFSDAGPITFTPARHHLHWCLIVYFSGS
jgi:hypothetical protein